ncbi:MAG: PA14 domain-containing protein, partial [Bacteroidota bacterium]
LEPRSIWYTGSSGIWQTVWLEPVPKNYIQRLRIEPDLDKERLVVKVETGGEKNDKLKITARVIEADRHLSESSGRHGTPHLLKVPRPHPWTPSDPYLYDLEVLLEDASGKQVDRVRSYFGMRKISLGKDEKGFTRLMLNNKFVFQIGPLDQGFFPDGLYTPPTEDAMKFDLEALKNMGFNMIRKHVKVEPARWYHLCDKMGFLVWQDMPSGLNESEADREQFRVELKAMVEGLFNHPAIVMWVPFNEGWGQHDDEQIVQLIKELDPTRLVNNASGWTDKGFGDVMDIHEYPGPAAPKPEEKRATVLGEFGGLGLNVAGHQWTTTGWGYDLIQTPENLLTRYEDLWRRLLPLVDSAGLSAAVYTQTSDIETENNGLLTYDRKVTKMDASLLRLAHEGYLPPKPTANTRIFVKKTAVELRTLQPGAEIFYTLDEKAPAEKWLKYQAPVSLKKSKTIRCRATWANGKSSHSESYSFKKVKPVGSKPPKNPAPGIALKMYEGSWDNLPDFKTLQPAKELTVNNYDLSQVEREEDFALVFEGWIEALETGVYTFFCSSDDGSRLFVANQKLIENDGLHGMKEVSGSIALKKGLHPVRLEFFQKKGGVGLKLEWEGAGISRRQL